MRRNPRILIDLAFIVAALALAISVAPLSNFTFNGAPAIAATPKPTKSPVVCPSGKVPDKDADSCKATAKPTASPKATRSPVVCPSGKVPDNDADSCKGTPKPTASPKATRSPVVCPSGKVPDNDADSCKPTPKPTKTP